MRRSLNTSAVALLMEVQAASLGVMATLHLTGALTGSVDAAGAPEALIGLVLLGGARALRRRGPGARMVAVGALLFAIAGFLLGLSFTLRGGNAIEIAYHATVLPLLIATLWLLRSQVPRAGSRFARE